ncbi:glutathione S-transferase family protein [Mesorhizobium sp. CU2]|uniref:glutathione S-transferase family protein n=1 Tax=unclassified Mesorhizobium TaxID=325217 RepID=UPI001125D6C7|nr:MULTISPECIES: glutathione S-transferase family protein [unclassified Mesorhizobium]TPN80589.1 glutathione S-transferase family protein [Mesorhizobium sp. CU3]TPO21910.1 glutathione S-transferase family protein [Mesorhizobium sp. CU2]
MILIGQYDSPFVRRVGIALMLYGLPFEHRPWSAFGDADKIRPYNPLTRVPTLVLDNGEVLIESHMMLDYLDSQVATDKKLFPASEPARRQALKVAALAIGLGDKIVSLFYEKRMHDKVSDLWVGRCRTQIETVLAVLEADRALRPGPWWFGDRFGHADIAVAVMLRFLADAHPRLVAMAGFPALAAHAASMEAMPVFQEISQPFIAPA